MRAGSYNMFICIANREDRDQTVSGRESALFSACLARQLVFEILEHLPCDQKVYK